MSKLYVYNCSQQIQEVHYTLPEVRGYRKYTIEMGRQTALNGELHGPELDVVIQQLERYGATEAGKIRDVKHYSGLIYSVDKPVNIDQIKHGTAHNKQVLVEEGKKIREQAAMAVNQDLENSTGAAPGVLEMSVEEEKSGSLESDEEHAPVSEGVRVTKRPMGRNK